MFLKPVIIGIKGLELSKHELKFIKKHQPWGFILFSRNIYSPTQVKELVVSLKESLDHKNVPILIDQEGGRVSRLSKKYWKQFNNAQYFGDLVKSEGIEKAYSAVKDNFHEIANILNELGINVNCTPLIDIPIIGADEIIGDRAFSGNKEIVSMLGKAACEGLMAGRVLPVIKHIPGHGRAGCDSHKELPVVSVSKEILEKEDFVPFKALNKMPLAMTAHVKYESLDTKNCATMSSIILDIIRQDIGFRGVLMTDDISMKALNGSFADRTVNSLKAGCDIVLHCNGKISEMSEVLNALNPVNIRQQNKLEKIWSFSFL